MYAAAPDLHTWIAGWVLHPYGPDYLSESSTASMRRSARTAAAGLKIYCTELGLATDDGRELSDNYGWPTT